MGENKVENKMENEMNNQMANQNVLYITQENEAYPEKLRHIYKPPKGLYVKGHLPNPNVTSLAIIGARDCSSYGREVAYYFGKELAKAGIQIISGLARGVDGAAHRGAVDEIAGTYGVLGCGIDVCYPKQNAELFLEMEKKGGIISEYPGSEPPIAGYFPVRNRIISGLSDGILVVEAREKSGSLITVEHALEQGKDIFVIPGRIYDELSKGCINLFKAGAIPVCSPMDILSYYGLAADEKNGHKKKIKNMLENSEEMVYSRLCLVPKHLNEVVNETNLPITEVMQTLISLEIKGYIKQPLKCYYIKQLE